MLSRTRLRVIYGNQEEVLKLLEEGDQAGALSRLAEDLPLFAAEVKKIAPSAPSGPSELEQRLAAINPDELTPKDALELLYELRRLLGN